MVNRAEGLRRCVKTPILVQKNRNGVFGELFVSTFDTVASDCPNEMESESYIESEATLQMSMVPPHALVA